MSTEPVVVAQRVAPPEAELRIAIPADLEYLRGHFAGAPVVPGVVQLKWAIDAARRHLGATGELVGMEALKFQRVLVPGAVATLTLTWVAATGKLYFSYRADDARFSSGRLLFRPAP
jgi:3-hydroxymyristoyl/3-hydroxydecanoyl-(acyl carrier protein) dehydratase